VEPDRRLPGGGTDGDEGLFRADAVVGDEGIGEREDLRGGTVVLRHIDRARAGKFFIKIEQEAHVRPAPGIDRLVGVPDDEKIAVVGAERPHQAVLRLVDVLELVDHHVFQPFLPFEADRLVGIEDMQREEEQIVVVKSEALFLLVEIAVKDHVRRLGRAVVLLLQKVEREGDHILVVVRLVLVFPHLDHIPRVGKGHLPQRKPPLLVDQGEHRVDIGIVQHDELFRIADGVRLLLEQRHAKAVEGTDEAGVVVPGQRADTAAHLVRRLVGEGHAEDVRGQDPHLPDQIGKAVSQRARLAAAGARQHPHVSLGRRDRLPLRVVQSVEQIHRPSSFCVFSIVAYFSSVRNRNPRRGVFSCDLIPKC